MKKIVLFLFTVTFLSCSSDDSTSDDPINDDQPNEKVLSILKLTEINNGETFIRYYNEDGTISKEFSMNVGDNEDDRRYTIYEYDNPQNLMSLKFYSANNEFLRYYQTYEYDSSSRLMKLTDYGDDTHNPYITTFSYSANKVDFTETETNRSGWIIFDENGRIIETTHQSGPSSFTTHFIDYNEDDQVIEISQSNGATQTLETNDTSNPLFNSFINKPIQYMVGEHYLYDIDFTLDTSYSINNIVKMSKSFDNNPLGIEETTFQYNSRNYPTSSTTTRADGSLIERTYEYY